MIEVTLGRAVLADRVWPGAGIGRNLALIMGGTLLVALCSKIEVPLEPVPITGQTFGVLLAGALLGSRRGVLSMLAYLSLGVIGLPVFALGGGGWARLTGPTAGYLAGFVVAAGVVGGLSERGWDRRTSSTLLAMSLGMLPIYFLGAVWLSRFVGWVHVVSIGIMPFVPGDALKVALAALALPRAWALIGRRDARGESQARK
jgi:biotin transport system substrate-specific component